MSATDPVVFARGAGASPINPINAQWFSWQPNFNQQAAVATLGNTGATNCSPAATGTNGISVEGLSGVYQFLTAAAGPNTVAGYTGSGVPTGTWRVRWAPFLRVWFRTGNDLTSSRLLIGYGATNFLSDNIASGGNNGCCIRYSTSASDPGFMGVTRSAAGVTAVTNLGMGITTDTEYIATIKVAAGSATWAVKNLTTGASVQVSAVAPFIASDVLESLIAGVCTTAAVQRRFYLTRLLWFYQSMQAIQDY